MRRLTLENACVVGGPIIIVGSWFVEDVAIAILFAVGGFVIAVTGALAHLRMR